MQKEPIVVVWCLCLLAGAGFAAQVCGATEDEQGIAVTLKENSVDTSIQNALKKAIEDNRKLNQEKRELEKTVKDREVKVGLYADRIKVLNDENEGMKRDIAQEKVRKIEYENRIKSELDSLTSKNAELENVIIDLKNKLNDKDYYREWEKVQSELNGVKQKVQSIVTESEEVKRENGKLHYNLANILFQRGEYQDAVYEYEYALGALPRDLDILYNLAVLYDYYLHNNERASFYYGEYLKEDPDSDHALEIKARIADNDFKLKMQ